MISRISRVLPILRILRIPQYWALYLTVSVALATPAVLFSGYGLLAAPMVWGGFAFGVIAGTATDRLMARITRRFR